MILRAALLLALGAPSAAAAADPPPRGDRPNLRSLGLSGGEPTEPLEVLIVGAGIAGLSCGYHLARLNPQTGGEIDFRLLEARPKVGGRIQNVKDESSFIDFDLDMGGTDLFLHDFDAYKRYLFDEEPRVDIEPSSWARDDVEFLKCDPECEIEELFRGDLDESSFEDSSLATFIEQNFLPEVQGKVRLNAAVTRIDYSDSDKIVATTSDGRAFEAKQLVVAVPLSQLKKGAITFVPSLPSTYQGVIDDSSFSKGVRIWVEFSEKFYKEATQVRSGRRYFDAARGKDTEQNIITIQGVDEPELATMSNEDIFKEVLEELDEAYADSDYDGPIATDHATNYFVKRWQDEPFIEMANARRRGKPANFDVLKEGVDDRIWFAGDYTLRGPENEAAESGKFVAGRVYQEHTKKPGLCESFRANDKVVGDEVCLSVSDRCEATAQLDGESCDVWCAQEGLTCERAWNDGDFCEKRGKEIDCGDRGNNVSICQCGVGLCQGFLNPDLIAGDEICSGTPQECVATAALEENGNESCTAWCARQGLKCKKAWDNGDFCEKTGTIPCGRTGNKLSICRCK